MPCLPDRVTEPKVFEFPQHCRLVQRCRFATVTPYQFAQLTFPTQRRNRQQNCWRLYPLRSGKVCELGHKKTTQILLSAPLVLCPCLQEFPSHNKFSPTTWAFGCSGGGEESGSSQANMWRNEMNDRLRLKEGNLKMGGEPSPSTNTHLHLCLCHGFKFRTPPTREYYNEPSRNGGDGYECSVAGKLMTRTSCPQWKSTLAKQEQGKAISCSYADTAQIEIFTTKNKCWFSIGAVL